MNNRTIRGSYRNMNVAWLVDQENHVSDLAQETQVKIVYPWDISIGEGHLEVMTPSEGISVYKGVHRFKPEAQGLIVDIGRFQGEYSGTCLAVQTMPIGRVLHHEHYPEKKIGFGGKQVLFRYSNRHDVSVSVDASHLESCMYGFSIQLSLLESLFSPMEVAQLLNTLSLTDQPSISINTISKSLLDLIEAQLTTQFTGKARLCFMQAKAIEFLSSLMMEQVHSANTVCLDPKSIVLAQRIHDDLLSLDGKLPSLDELAQTYHLPSRKLNAIFVQEYGVSIYEFITAHRLKQAYVALTETNVPIKQLSERLGYSHTNHFGTAFKNKFGCTPSSLRKK